MSVMIGQLTIEMAANIVRLQTDMGNAKRVVGSTMQQIQQSVDLAQKAIIGLTGVASVAAFEGMVKGAIEGVASLGKLSQQAGMTVEALSGLAAVGKLTGTGADTIAAASNKLSKALATQTEDSKGAAAALRAIGLSFDNFQNMAPEERMQKIAIAMGQFQDGGQKSAAAMLLFGKSGAELLPMLKDLADAGDLHAKVTTQQAQAAHGFEMGLGKLKAQSEAWKKSMAMELLPTLNDVLDVILTLKKSTADDGVTISEGVKVVIQTLAVLGVNIIYVFKQVANEVGGIGAQLVALAHLDWSGFKAIGQAMADDAAKARIEVDKLSMSLLGLTNSKAGAGRGGTSWTDPRALGIGEDFKAQITGLNGVTSAASDQSKAYDNLVASIKARIAQVNLEIIGGKPLNEAQKMQLEIDKLVNEGKIQLTASTRKFVDALMVQLKASVTVHEAEKAALVVAEARQKQRESEAATIKAFMESLDAAAHQQLVGVQSSIDSMTRENDAIALSKSQHITLAQAVERVTIARHQEQQSARFVEGSEGWQNIQAEIDKRKELLTLIDTKAVRDQEQAGWQSLFTSLDCTAHAVWTNVLQGGQDAFTRIGNTLKSAVLDLLYQMTIKRWIISVSANLTGNSSASALSSSSGIGNILSAGNSLYSAYTGQAGATMQGALTYGSEALGLTGAGSAGVMAASESASVAATAAGASAAEAAAAAGTAASTAAAGSAAMMSTLATVAPYLAAAVALYAAFASGGDKPSLEGGYATAGGPTGSANGHDFVGGVYGGVIDASAKKVVDDLQTSYSATVKALGGKVGALTAQSFMGINQGDSGSPNALHLDAQLNGKWLYNRWTDNGGSLDAGTTTADMQAAADLSTKKIIIEALKVTDLAPVLNEYLATVVTQGKTLDQITTTLKDISNLAAFNQAVRALPFDYLSKASAAAALALISSAGGVDKFQASLGTFVDLFYSESDKTSFATKALSNAFAALGVTMPAIDSHTRDWYKSQIALAGAQDLSIQANADQYNSLINLASAVNALAPAAVDAAAALRATVLDNLKSTTSSISAILKGGMLGTIAREDVGGQVADAISAGLKEAMAQTIADQIAATFTTSIITPIIDAVLKGAAISSAVSQATIDGAVASAKQSMDAIAALFNDPGFQSLLLGIKSSLGGSSGSTTTSVGINTGAAQGNNGAIFGGSATQGTAAAVTAAVLTYAQQHAQVDAYNAFAHANPIAATGSAGQVVYRQQQEFHLSANDAADQIKSLQTALEGLSASTQTEAERRAAERYVVDDSNLALYDRVQMLRDEAAATELSKSALATKQTWQDKLDVLTGKTTESALQQARDIAAVTEHEDAAKAQLVYVTDAAARATLQQAIATDEATKAIIGQVYAQQQAAAAAAAAAQVAAERQSWQDKLDLATGKTTATAQQMQKDLASTTDEATKALIRQYYAQIDLTAAANAAAQAAKDAQAAAVKTTDDAMAALQRAVEVQRKAVQTQLQVAQESVTTLTSVFNTLKSNVADLYGQVDSTKAMSAAQGQSFIDIALAAAQTTGYMPDQTELADAIAAVRKGVDAGAYATTQEVEAAKLILAGKLDQLKTIGGTQLTAAQQAAKVAQDQLDALDKVVAGAQAQINALRDIDTSVVSVQEAVDRLSAAILAERAATIAVTGGAATGSTSTAAGGGGGVDYHTGVTSGPLAAASGGGFANIQSAQATLLNNNLTQYATDNFKSATAATISSLGASNSGFSIFGTAVDALATLNATANSNLTSSGLVAKYLLLDPNTTMSMADRTAYNMGQVSATDMISKYSVPTFATGGDHFGGLRLVGENGPELEATGPARYFNANTTASMLRSGGASDSEVKAELNAMRNQLAMMQRDMQQSVLNTSRTNKTLDKVIVPASVSGELALTVRSVT